MNAWPDAEEALLRAYVAGRGLKNPRPYASVLRRFQRFVATQAEPLGRRALEAWLKAAVAASTLRMAVRRAQLVAGFLDWLVARGAVAGHPLAELRGACRRPSTAAVVRALVSGTPDAALAALRGRPRFGSHLGPAIQAHVARMQALGFRYDERPFRRFDEFLQQRPGAPQAPLAVLVREYAARAPSAAGQLERVKVGRAVARALRRSEPAIAPVPRDRVLARAAARARRPPYIFTPAELERLLAAARAFPSPKAPLRPLTVYTMLVLAYCAGLRMGELVRLQLGDLRWDEQALDIRESKFFKSRRLPIAASTVAVLEEYCATRRRAGLPQGPEAPLFCHRKGGYAYVTAEHLLRRVLRLAGLKTGPGRVGPRPHDLRHSFVVHRMLAWYRAGIDPQAKLPYLWTYLGHRGLHSTLVYLTITQELLHQASERFRRFAAPALAGSAEAP